jgi:hypothetical protein
MQLENYLDVTVFRLIGRNVLAYIAVRMLVVERKKRPLNLLPVQQVTRGQIRKIVMVMPPRAPSILIHATALKN